MLMNDSVLTTINEDYFKELELTDNDINNNFNDEDIDISYDY